MNRREMLGSLMAMAVAPFAGCVSPVPAATALPLTVWQHVRLVSIKRINDTTWRACVLYNNARQDVTTRRAESFEELIRSLKPNA